jgi:hypothetical protein
MQAHVTYALDGEVPLLSDAPNRLAMLAASGGWMVSALRVVHVGLLVAWMTVV